MGDRKYHRVLLKVSGEALAGEAGVGLDFDVIRSLADAIAECKALGTEMGIVIGGGNFWRGVKNGSGKMERTRADRMGMLATVMNCLAVADVLEQKGIPVRVETSIAMPKIAEEYTIETALHHLKKGRVVLLGGGVGSPFFSTDTGVVLRAAELRADCILLAKNVDGVYSEDPKINPRAKKYTTLTYNEVLSQHLQAMDTTATGLAMDNHIPVFVFALKDPRNIVRAVMGENIGTVIK